MSKTSIQERAAQASAKAKQVLDKTSGNGVVRKARAFVSGDAQFFSAQPKMDQIRKQLESDSVSEKKEGMKRVIAQICKGTDMSPMFADVVKNILVPSIELRKLVYYYIVHYAEDRPNEALLSVSAFQKDLVDPSMHVRSLALRVLGSIRIGTISPVVMIAVKKGSSDMTAIVRKASAVGLTKIHSMNPDESEDTVIPMLEQLLGDRSPEVVGAAAFSFKFICPNRMDLIHKHFRKMCRSLADVDEWGQIMLLDLLSRYARSQFLDPSAPRVRPAKEKQGSDSDDDDDDDDTESTMSDGVMGLDLDSDHRLLLQSVKPMFLSLNRAVVLQAVSLYFHVAPVAELDVVVRPLIRLLTACAEGNFVVLSTIYSIMTVKTSPFVPFIKEFYITGEDPINVREVKIRCLAKLINRDNMGNVLREFRSYIRSYDMKKVVAAVTGLGLIASNLAETGPHIMRTIAPMLSHKNTDVVTQCVIVLRQLVVQSTDRGQVSKIIHKLLASVMKEAISTPPAKAAILWLVGEHIHTHVTIARAAPDCFRTYLKNFTNEPTEVRRQVLALGTKLWLHLEGQGELAQRFKELFVYLLELVKFDPDFDVRDRGRVVECCLDRNSEAFNHLKGATIGTKPVPRQSDVFIERSRFQVGSLTHLTGAPFNQYQAFPEWPEEMPDPNARDPKVDKSESEDDSIYTSSSDDSGSDSSDVSSGSDSDSDSESGSDSGSDTQDKKKPTIKIVAKKAPAKVLVSINKGGSAPVATDRVVNEFYGETPTNQSFTSPVHADPNAEEQDVKSENEPKAEEDVNSSSASSAGDDEGTAKPPADDFFGGDGSEEEEEN